MISFHSSCQDDNIFFLTRVLLLFFKCNLRYRSMWGKTRRNMKIKTIDDINMYLSKLQKAELDNRFLHACKRYNMFPKILRFKLYKQRLHNTQMYSEFQEKLLQHELSAKRKIIDLLSSNVSVSKQELKPHVSVIDFHALNLFISKNILKFQSRTNNTHDRKLQELGGRLQLTSCNPDNVIF